MSEQSQHVGGIVSGSQDEIMAQFQRRVAPADPAQVRRVQRQRISGAVHPDLTPEARQHARQLLASLDTIEGVRDTHGVIRGMARAAGAGGDGPRNAQAALDAQRQIISQADADAQAALKALRPALLAAVVSLPDGVSKADIAEKKADLCAALEAAGTSGANYRAQQILSQALASGDRLMAYVVCSPEVMGYRAPALGYRLDTLQQKYAQAQIEKVGLRPLLASQAVPGGELINLLPEIAEAISGHTAAARADLAQLAAEVNLS